jgi:hypothetical protein
MLKMSKYYEIPCSWEVYGTMEVEANSLEEAIELAERDDSPMPDASDYVDGSFEVDRDVAEEINKDDDG